MKDLNFNDLDDLEVIKMNNKNKAISPIIAVILLVGVAIGAAALAYSWYMGIQKGTQAVGGTAAGQTAQASSAAMQITFVNSTTITIKNIGGVDINTTLITCTPSVNSSLWTDTDTLNPGESATTQFLSSLGSGVTNIKCVSAEGAVATYQYIS